MSQLICLPKRSHFAPDKGFFKYIFDKNTHFGELGCLYAENNILHRNIFYGGDIKALEIFLGSKNYNGAIIYANNPDSEYPYEEYSPLKINDDYGFAQCGNSLDDLKIKVKESNAGTFSREILLPSSKSIKNFGHLDPFMWLIRRVIRPYVGMAFLHKGGHLFVINSTAFTQFESKSHKGSRVFHMDFASAKESYLKKK